MKIAIFGDICPTKDTKVAFDRGDTQALFGETLAQIDASDIVIGNLECAVTDNPIPIKKAGPVLYTSTKSIESLRGFDALSIANNHIRDCGDEGVVTAIETCQKMGINTFGAGHNIQQAREPLVIEKCGKRIGLMSFAEQEFNMATDSRPGACYLDPYDDFDRIRQFRMSVDYLIILYHGGIEYFPYPSPELSRKCRKMVDCGADLVTCQHSHCIGTIENYCGATIVYGQGNSVFGYRKDNDTWNRGLLLFVDVEKRIVTYKGFEATPVGLRWLQSNARILLDEELNERANISNADLSIQWDDFCRKHALIHLPLLLGWPRWLIAINRRSNNLLVKLLFSKKKYNNTHNLLRCDALKEVLLNVLRKQDYL